MKKVTRFVGYHGKIFLRGFFKALYGAAVAGLVAMAVNGFGVVSSEDGYMAVCDFIGAVATMCVAFSCIYAFGCSRKKNGSFSSKW